MWCETHSKHFTPKQVIKIAICFKFYLNVIQQKNKFEVVDTDDEQTVSHGQVQGVENELEVLKGGFGYRFFSLKYWAIG